MLSFFWKMPKSVNVKPLEQKVQQLEQANKTINQKLQQLEQTNNNLNNSIQTLTQQITDLSNQIGPIINDARHFVKANQTNNFQVVQKITADGAGINFEQFPNQSAYINFQKNDGTRRGYVGMSSGQNDQFGIMGKEGINLTTTTGDVSLNPAGDINVNNNRIKNLADPTNPTDAISWDYLDRRIKTIEGQWNSYQDNKLFRWPNIPAGVYKILDLKLFYGTTNSQTANPVIPNDIITLNDDTITFSGTAFKGTPGPRDKLFAKLTYITLR